MAIKILLVQRISPLNFWLTVIAKLNGATKSCWANLLSTTGIFDQLKAGKILSGPDNLGNQFVGTFLYFTEGESGLGIRSESGLIRTSRPPPPRAARSPRAVAMCRRHARGRARVRSRDAIRPLSLGSLALCIGAVDENRLDVDDRRAIDGLDRSIRNRVPEISRTVTRCSPNGFGRWGDRVVNTPASGTSGSPRGCTSGTSRSAR
jgi:hypothetical protein